MDDGPEAPAANGRADYDVFISYSRRADQHLAELLQRELQRFAKPVFRRRSLRVFRDNANLSANPGLWSSIQEALESSRYLVLLASPEAADSGWVGREIEHWRATHPAGRLLLVVTDGEVAWDEQARDFDRSRSTAIPAALAGAFGEEPRFVDLRAGDGNGELARQDPRIAAAVADLAAPVHGRSKDELVGEDLRQHRRLVRVTRTAVVVLAALLLAAIAGGIVAVRQRNEATSQRQRAEAAATEAQRAAADSEFRRLANAASTAPTRRDALALSVAALTSADQAGRDEGTAVRPLVTALARGDLPLLRFAAQSPGQGSSGERQGVDASLDGTTLAFIANDGTVAIWDLTELAPRTAISAVELGGAAEQVGLWEDGTLLAVLAYPPSSERGEDGQRPAVLSIFDVTGSTATLVHSGEIAVLSASALAFGPTGGVVLVVEEEGTLVVAKQESAGFTVTRVGEQVPASNAGIVVTGFSVDGQRACSLGEALQVYQVEPPAQITFLPPPERPAELVGAFAQPDPLRTGLACLPEPCGGSGDSFAVTTEGGFLRCLEPDGTDVTLESDQQRSLGSVAYTGLLPVPRIYTVYGWRVTPYLHSQPLPLAEFNSAPEASAFRGADLGRQAGLIGVRVVRAGAGVGLLTVDDDGLIELWSPANGALPPTARMETGDAETTLTAIGGAAGLAGSYAFSVDEAGGVRVVEVDGGAEVASWTAPPPAGVPDATGAPVLMWRSDADTLVELLDDGTVVSHDLRSGTSDQMVIPVSGPIALDEVDMNGGRVALLDGTTAVVARLDDGSIVARFDVEGDSCTDSVFPNETSFVDLSDDGQSLAVVRCRSPGPALVQVFDTVDGGVEPETVDLRYSFPTSVSVANGAAVVAVASTLGQIGILRDGRWIEPDTLKGERAAHNQYQRGWAAVDPEGRLLLTRRDAADVELWALDGEAVERIARVEHDGESPPPALAQFAPGSSGFTLAWDSDLHYDTETTTTLTSTWSFDRKVLLGLACPELADGAGDYAARAGVTTLAECS